MTHRTGLAPIGALSLSLLPLAIACSASDGHPNVNAGGARQGAAGSVGGAGGLGGSATGGERNFGGMGGSGTAEGGAMGGAGGGGAGGRAGVGGGGVSDGGAGVGVGGGGVSDGGTGAGGGEAGAGGGVGRGGADGGGAGGSGTTDAGMPGPGTAGDGGTVPAIVSGGIRWIGRVDLSSPATPKFAWSGSGFVATATGGTLSVSMRSDGAADPIYFQPVIDGAPGTRVSVAAAEGVKTLILGSGLTPGDHVVELYRETEGKAGYAASTFLGFVDGTLKAPPSYGGRLIEIVGDSISAGYGDLGTEQHPNFGPDPTGGCRFSTQTESAYVTYGAVAARAVGADASIVAASGWGIYSDNLGNTTNVLPRVYANTIGGQMLPAWSFAVEPQAVIINLGTNDFAANMTLGSDAFTTAYRAFLATVRGKYAHAWIYCAIGSLLYGPGLTNATAYIDALVASVNAGGDAKVKVLDFGQQNTSLGTGCDYHPSVAEHQRMAGILTNELRGTLGW